MFVTKDGVNATDSTPLARSDGNASAGITADDSRLETSDVIADLTRRFRLCRSIAEECVQDDEELMRLLHDKSHPVAYDGFEPSGRMHVAQGITKIMNVNRLVAAGFEVKIWIADWFAQLNGKLDGDLDRIRLCGDYMVEIWRCSGMEEKGVQFLRSSEEIGKRSDEYWTLVMDIARRNTLNRVVRCSQIMGRSEKNDLSAAQIMYPCMQCADVFFLGADVCQMGMDQRKVNMLAREYAEESGRRKPVILSHHMLPGLQSGQDKMSKSDPKGSVFMDDSAEDVERKIAKAYCPPRVTDRTNPCVEYVKHLIFPWYGLFQVTEDRSYKSYDQFEKDYADGNVHPKDLKVSLARSLNAILEPVRHHFEHDPIARDLRARFTETLGSSSAYSAADLSQKSDSSHTTRSPLRRVT